jgi:hypothetical protein
MAEEQNRSFQDKFMLRLPDGMRDRIKAAAEANQRSMNSEIVTTLLKAYPDPNVTRDMMAFVAAWLREHAIQVDPNTLFFQDYLRMAADAYFRQFEGDPDEK